jgi:hypothetical protein
LNGVLVGVQWSPEGPVQSNGDGEGKEPEEEAGEATEEELDAVLTGLFHLLPLLHCQYENIIYI